uniref:Ig-like domain-containing protein n=1 Tax=Chelonoidis abingdonii TaxID=106734 RepID=A0A8C0G1H1_CHEAB
MVSVRDLLKCCLFLPFPESSGQIVITQTPASVTVLPGETVTIQCKASSSMSDDMSLFLFKSGQNPKLLIHDANSRFTGVPDRFSGSYSGTDFTFTIRNVQAEDAGEYYCGQDNSYPLTVIQFITKTSMVPLHTPFMLQPSWHEAEGNISNKNYPHSGALPLDFPIIGFIQHFTASKQSTSIYSLASTLDPNFNHLKCCPLMLL